MEAESILALLAEEIIKNQHLAVSRIWLVHALRSAEISLTAVVETLKLEADTSIAESLALAREMLAKEGAGNG